MFPVHGLPTPPSRPAESGRSEPLFAPAPEPPPIPPGGIIGIPGGGAPPPGNGLRVKSDTTFGTFGTFVGAGTFAALNKLA